MERRNGGQSVIWGGATLGLIIGVIVGVAIGQFPTVLIASAVIGLLGGTAGTVLVWLAGSRRW